MRLGIIGVGKMGSALAEGFGGPVYCIDAGSGQAQKLVERLGGRAFSSNRELAANVDAIVLAHPPQAVYDIAATIADIAKVVVSLLSRVPQQELHRAYPTAAIFRIEPNTAVAIRQGVLVLAEVA